MAVAAVHVAYMYGVRVGLGLAILFLGGGGGEWGLLLFAFPAMNGPSLLQFVLCVVGLRAFCICFSACM